MDGRFNNPFMSEQEEEEDPEITTTSSPTLSSSPPNNNNFFSSSSAAAAAAMAIHDHSRITSSSSNSLSSPKKSSRRSVQKRVVSIPIGDVDGSRLKGEGAPPSDSWAWRKYGQKPIKGSPYPRGYYRCSSSKGCPARKQVERSRVDPTMLVITYACEHNHPWPASRNSNSTTTAAAAAAAAAATNNKSINNINTTLAAAPPPPPSNKKNKFAPEKEPPAAVFVNQTEIEPDEKFGDLGDDSLIITDDYGCWFSDVASTSPTVLESPICLGSTTSSCSNNNNELDAADMAMIFPMREEDESLFADLGELPECSFVFRRGFFEQEEERRRCSLRTASWCGSTG